MPHGEVSEIIPAPSQAVFDLIHNYSADMTHKEFEVTTDGLLSFSIQTSHGQPWWWYLDLDGEPLYLLSNTCGTCSATFQRVHDKNLPLAPSQLDVLLENGLQSVSQEIIDTIAFLLPQGTYRVGLLTVKPSLIHQGRQPSVVSCEADYFWLCQLQKNEREAEYEIILPLVPEKELDQSRIDHYRAKLENDQQPTALALSLADGRSPMGRYYQWVLAHFLLDGHHKLMAAAQLSKPISLLSFLAVSKSVASLSENTIRQLSEYNAL